jgi:hypothetical protein
MLLLCVRERTVYSTKQIRSGAKKMRKDLHADIRHRTVWGASRLRCAAVSRGIALAVFASLWACHVLAHAGGKQPASSVAAGTFLKQADIWTRPDTKAGQTLSPDNGALSILLDSLSASAQSDQVLTANATVIVRVGLAPKHATHLVVDLRGSSTTMGSGRCRIILATPGAVQSAHPISDGTLRSHLRLPILPGAHELIIMAAALCEHEPEANAALGTIDSLDLAWDRDPVADSGTHGAP